MREKGSMCPVCARAWCVRELESVGTRARKSCVRGRLGANLHTPAACNESMAGAEPGMLPANAPR